MRSHSDGVRSDVYRIPMLIGESESLYNCKMHDLSSFSQRYHFLNKLLGIQRHQAGDWGNLTDDNRTANDRALAQGRRIVSAHNAMNGTRFWLITEADRSRTTILLPEDY